MGFAPLSHQTTGLQTILFSVVNKAILTTNQDFSFIWRINLFEGMDSMDSCRRSRVPAVVLYSRCPPSGDPSKKESGVGATSWRASSGAQQPAPHSHVLFGFGRKIDGFRFLVYLVVKNHLPWISIYVP